MIQEPKICQPPERVKGLLGDCSPEQIKARHSTSEDHQGEAPTDDQVLQAFKAQVGFLPKFLVLMAKRPGLLNQFFRYGKTLFEGGPLTDRERFWVALSAAAALKTEDCRVAQSKRALAAGATADEVLQTVLIAGMISNTSALHLAYRAVDGISFEVERAELFGFLGPNGAGKTSTINMLTGQLLTLNNGHPKL